MVIPVVVPSANDERHAPKIIRANAQRNAWLYDQYCNHPERTVGAIRSEAAKKGWHLGSNMAVNRAINRYCEDNALPTPKRKQSRIKQD